MRLVTYDAGAGPRVGALAGEDAVVDLGFGGDMVDYIAAGAPAGHDRPGRERAAARAAAPALAARLPRVRGPHEERALPPRPADPRRVVRGARVLQGDAGHGDRPGRGDPVAGVDRQARPRARAGRRDRPRGARRRARGRRRLHLRLHDLERHVGARRAGARAADRHGPGQGEGLGRLERARPVHRHRRRARRVGPRHARARERRAVGRGHVRPHAPHLRGHDRLRLALADAVSGRGLRLGHRPAAAPAWSSTAGLPRATSSSWRSRGSACCAIESRTRELCEMAYVVVPSGPPRTGRRTGSRASATR